MSTILWKDGKEYRIDALAVNRHLASGYTLTNEQDPNLKPIVVDQMDAESNECDDVDLEAARQMYEERFGDRPHGRMKLNSILEKLENADKPL